MDWRSIKFDWNRARAFLVTAEEGSLSRAAKALDTTQPTLSRQVAALERELGVQLFERTGRGLVLTPAGLELCEHARAMGAAAGRVSLSATGLSEAVTGTIRIAVSEVTAAFQLPAIIARLRRLEPEIDIELSVSNASSDLQRREADIAVRMYRPSQPELIARKIKDVPIHLYAANTYLAENGFPETQDDLRRMTLIGFDSSDDLVDALRLLGLGLARSAFRIRTDNQLAAWALVKAGAGIGMMLAEVGDKEPSVGRAMPSLGPIVAPMWLTSHRELQTSRRVRLVYDFLADALAN